MKISMIGPVYPFRGGIAHHTTLLTRCLSQSHQVQLISFKSQYPTWLYPGKSDREPGKPTVQVDAQYLLSPTNPFDWMQTVKAVENFEPKCVIFPWWTTFWAPAFAACAYLLQKKGIPVIFLIHNALPHEARFFDRFVTRKVLKHGCGFIVQSEREEKRLKDVLPDARIKLVSHPIYNQLGTRVDKKEARARLGLSPEDAVILFFGFVRAYKGLRYLLEALILPPLKQIRPCLVVAGEIWKEKDTYNRQIQSGGLENQVRLVDRYIPDEEIPDYFSAADVFVAPYADGSQSGSLKLAFAFGLPVVATDIIVGEEERQIAGNLLTVVPPADPNSLAQAIHGVLSHPGVSYDPVFSGDDSWQSIVKAIEELL